MARKTAKRRPQGAGSVRQLPSGRWQARYRDEGGALRSAPATFETKLDASTWLATGSFAEVEEARTDPTLSVYAATWLAGREVKPRTREGYQYLLDALIVPGLGSLRLSQITPARVRAWYAALDPGKRTQRAHVYSLLKAIMRTAVDEEYVNASPCRIRGAGQAKTTHQPRPATLPELTVIVDAMPPRYRAMVLLAAWCGLRFGELTELRRADIDAGAVRVQRGVVRVGGGYVVGDPKSAAGKRLVTMPPHLVPVVEQHLADHVAAAADALVFPAVHGGHMAPSSLYKVWYPAREAAARPDLRFHDLRHTGATLAAATGATLADLMARLGHSTTSAAMRYQHAAQDRDKAIAEALSGFATAGSVALRAR